MCAALCCVVGILRLTRPSVNQGPPTPSRLILSRRIVGPVRLLPLQQLIVLRVTRDLCARVRPAISASAFIALLQQYIAEWRLCRSKLLLNAPVRRRAISHPLPAAVATTTISPGAVRTSILYSAYTHWVGADVLCPLLKSSSAISLMIPYPHRLCLHLAMSPYMPMCRCRTYDTRRVGIVLRAVYSVSNVPPLRHHRRK